MVQRWRKEGKTTSNAEEITHHLRQVDWCSVGLSKTVTLEVNTSHSPHIVASSSASSFYCRMTLMVENNPLANLFHLSRWVPSQPLAPPSAHCLGRSEQEKEKALTVCKYHSATAQTCMGVPSMLTSLKYKTRLLCFVYRITWAAVKKLNFMPGRPNTEVHCTSTRHNVQSKKQCSEMLKMCIVSCLSLFQPETHTQIFLKVVVTPIDLKFISYSSPEWMNLRSLRRK